MKSTVSPNQLAMFEPSGSELATLARTHADTAASFERQASNLELRGFTASATSYYLLALAAQDRSFVCELALQFEVLADLS